MLRDKGKESLFYVGSTKIGSYLTVNQPEADGALIPSPPLPPSLHQCYGYLKLLKATQKGEKSKEGFEFTPGNHTRDLPHRRPRTNELY